MCTRAVGGLAHYLEEAGIATTQISLVRLHTEQIKPPRALWVPFALGRPFGPPNEPNFQTRVLTAALELLERKKGPLLEDFPDDEPLTAGEQSGWACPVNFSRPSIELNGVAAIEAALKDEIAIFAPWYDIAVKTRGRTTVGLSGLDLNSIATFFAAMFNEPLPLSPSAEVSLADMIRLAAEDLKAYYIEAASVQPGAAGPQQLADWFWADTVAADTLRRMKPICLAANNEALNMIGRMLLVPFSQAR